MTVLVKPKTSPLAAARDLRSRAESAQGAERAYLLWLAAEWEKVAGREADAATTASHRTRDRSHRDGKGD